MRGQVSGHIRSNVWGIAACFAALMGTAVVASASDPRATTSAASPTKQVKKLKRKLASVEQRLAALESRGPIGAAGGELAGTYPNPTIGTVNGLDLAASTTPSGGISFGGDSTIYRVSPNNLVTGGFLTAGSGFFTQGTIRNFGDADFGFDFADETQLFGWLNTAVVSSAPVATECDTGGEVGRIVFNTNDNKLYICDQGADWRTIDSI